MAVTFLTVSEFVLIHRDQIGRYGGAGGVRDVGPLRSAVAAPAAGTADGYLRSDLHEMAAAYLFHIVRDHPFVDGNKRTGGAAAAVFLDMNGLSLEAGEAEFERLVTSVADGSVKSTCLPGRPRQKRPGPPSPACLPTGRRWCDAADIVRQRGGPILPALAAPQAGLLTTRRPRHRGEGTRAVGVFPPGLALNASDRPTTAARTR